MSLIADTSQKIADRLTWHTANRDQAGIAKYLTDGKDIPEVYGLGEAGLFDEFFCFLDQFGFKDLFMGLDLKSKKRESKVPFMAVIFRYFKNLQTHYGINLRRRAIKFKYMLPQVVDELPFEFLNFS
ncbi:MAG: hypothetical protein JRD93_14810 [Deltaproteobacteria bacterium]|nr:hypothetical protein [Deltaproteobacteria bacterium]